jgi:putative transposase
MCYIFIPYTTTEKLIRVDNQDPKIIALDPGVRTFHTGYSPNGDVLHIGKGEVQKIMRLCVLLDKMQSLINNKKIKCKKRLRVLKKMRKIRIKIKNLKSDLHWKTSNYLCKNYNIILLPNFNVTKLTKRQERKIKTKTARSMINWNHGEFRQRLNNKSKDYNACKIITCNESYTSKTCTSCGNINEKLGGNKLYKCQKCKFEIDRDINGARNILLRALFIRKSQENETMSSINFSRTLVATHLSE